MNPCMGSSKCQLLPAPGRGDTVATGSLRAKVQAPQLWLVGAVALPDPVGKAAPAQQEWAPSGRAAAPQPVRDEASPLQSAGSGAGRAWGMLPSSPKPSLHLSLPLPTTHSALGTISAEQQQPRGWSVARHSSSAAAVAGECSARPSFPPYKGKAPSPTTPLGFPGMGAEAISLPGLGHLTCGSSQCAISHTSSGLGPVAAPFHPAPVVAACSLSRTSAVVFTAYLTLLRSPSALQLSDW